MMGNGLDARLLDASWLSRLSSLAGQALVSGHEEDGILIVAPHDDDDDGGGDGLVASPEARSLLSYAVGCALGEGDVLMVQDGEDVHLFSGHLGLARAWKTRGLVAAEAESVSACLIAHGNAFGERVILSGRMIGKLGATESERASHRGYEGTFFGRALASAGQDDRFALYACQGDAAEIARAHSPVDRHKRACTDGHEDCGDIVALGRCRDVCDSYVDEHGWTDCWADGVRYSYTFSAFLADGDPDGANAGCAAGASCTRGSALVTESFGTGTRAIVSCRGSMDCAAVCSAGDICTLDGAQVTEEFAATVEVGARAKIDAYNAGAAEVACTGPGTRCEIDCKSAGSCSARCEAGASCVLECADADSCGFAICHEPAGARACDRDIQVCGGECP